MSAAVNDLLFGHFGPFRLLQQFGETRIRANRIDGRIDVEVGEIPGAFLDRPVEGREGVVMVAEADVDEGDAIRGDVPLPCDLLQFREDRAGSFGVAAHARDVADRGEHLGRAAGGDVRGLELRKRCGELAGVSEGQAEQETRP